MLREKYPKNNRMSESGVSWSTKKKVSPEGKISPITTRA